MRAPLARRARATLASAVPVLIGACSAGQPADIPVGKTQQAAVCAAGAVVKGVDVSEFQGTVDWATYKQSSGWAFALARVSDGTTHVDAQFDANWAGMKSAGVIRGAYQFFEPGQDPTAQADLVIQKVGMLGTDDIPVVADVEVSGGVSPATVVANLQTWGSRIQAGTGKTPIIETSPGLWTSIAGGSTAFGSFPLWVQNWGTSCPSLPSGWSNWAFWNYSDSGTGVPGISATVDLDEFNGDLATLAAFDSGLHDWGAVYVSQSWPLASTTMQMTVNQVLPASIVLKNVGTKSWDSNTRLATTGPRDRVSAFAGSDWIAPNRLAAVSGSVAPGQTFSFAFDFHAPSTPGAYDELFGVIEEGVAWFGDPAQGGPPDNAIEAKIQVNEAQYHAQLVGQTFPTAAQAPLAMTTGQSLDGTIELKNVGTATWKAGETKLAPTPRDTPSPIGAAGWLSATRVSSPPADVPPGQSYAFPVRLAASAPGDYTQTFGVIDEGVTWFADAPLGGGPPDNQIAVHVIVTASDAGADADAGGADAGGADAGGADAAEGAGGADAAAGDAAASAGDAGDAGARAAGAGAKGGCSCRAMGEGAPPPGAGAWLAALGLGAVVARRRGRARG